MQQVKLTDDEIRRMIDDYTPSDKTIEVLNRRGLVIFVGMTGVGKDTIMSRLVDTDKYRDAITSTTRAPRKNDGIMEADGVDYYFISLDEAINNLKTGRYAEVSWVHDRVNGMLADELNRPGSEKKVTITDVDIQGAIKFRKLSNNVQLFFVLPPSFAEWDRRNRSRYPNLADFEAAWPVRRNSSIMEMEMVLENADMFKFIVNDDLAQTVASIRRTVENDQALDYDADETRAIAETILEELRAN